MKNKKWVAIRNNEICGVFENRKEVIRWFKELLNQTLKDCKNQDKTDEYDYPIEVYPIKIFPFEQRSTFLGL